MSGCLPACCPQPRLTLAVVFAIFLVDFVPSHGAVGITGTGAAETAGAAAGEAVAEATAVNCVLDLQGVNNSLSSGWIQCSGGWINAAADAAVIQQLLASNSSGVAWQQGSCGLPQNTCMLTICGINSSSSSSNISGIKQPQIRLQLSIRNFTDDLRRRWGVVCIAGDARVTVKVGQHRLGHHNPVESSSTCAMLH